MNNKEVVDHVSTEVLKWRRMKQDEEEDNAEDGTPTKADSLDDQLNELRQTAEDFLHGVCKDLCKRAKRRGSRDDITVIIVVFEPPRE